eukprot:1149472-Pelagomonas_calceolata.AAC.2
MSGLFVGAQLAAPAWCRCQEQKSCAVQSAGLGVVLDVLSMRRESKGLAFLCSSFLGARAEWCWMC